ncbi:MAG: hypothetical protein ABW061_18265 [Polyangiaceae bacterium]
MTEAEETTHSPEASEPAPEPAQEPARSDAVDVPLNADGRERPRFLLEFPADPELQRLVRAFEAGNYQAVREGAPQLAERTEDPIVRAAARELRRRIDPDPLMKYLLWTALGLFVFVVWYTYQGQH